MTRDGISLEMRRVESHANPIFSHLRLVVCLSPCFALTHNQTLILLNFISHLAAVFFDRYIRIIVSIMGVPKGTPGCMESHGAKVYILSTRFIKASAWDEILMGREPDMKWTVEDCQLPQIRAGGSSACIQCG